MYYRGDPQPAGGLVRSRFRTVPALFSFALIALMLVASACGSSGKPATSSGDVPTATLPSTLPAAVIVSGTPRPPSGSERYVVKTGDTPSSIAAQFDVSLDELLSVNNITDPTGLHAGDELIIPGATPTPEEPTPAPTAAPRTTPRPTARATSAPVGQTYTVQDGDIPETIAARFGITADELMAANNITDATSLQIGQVLTIPAARPTATQ
jgi:LysM repeat protein